MNRPALTAFALLAAVCFGLPAAAQQAQPKVGDRIGDWVYQCQTVKQNQTVCGLVQNIADRGTRKQVLGVAVREFGSDNRLAMLVTAPLGIFLGSGIGGKVDDGEQFAFNLQSCSQRGCQGAIEINDRLLEQLKKGSRLMVGFKARPNEDTVVIPVSLKGFTAGIAAIQAQ